MAEILWEQRMAGGRILRIVRCDITVERVDAIVNAANSQLAHGGGVAGAIVRAGGIEIQEESHRVAPVAVGHVAVTGAGRLACKAVIHAVGPRMGEGDEDAKLASAVRNALQAASERNFRSISMPAISSGIFGYPKDRCARMLLQATRDFLAAHSDSSLAEVRFCNFDEETCSIFLREFQAALPTKGA